MTKKLDCLIDIQGVVPHRDGMLLVDRLEERCEDFVAVGASIGPDNLFARADGVPAWVGIEYMAQAIAAWAGCRAMARGEPARIGFLLGTRRYQCDGETFQFGTRLRIEARREFFADNGLGMFSCRILVAGVERANAQLSVYEPPDAVAPQPERIHLETSSDA